MRSLKITTIVLAFGFAAGVGCGSDSGGKTDGPVIGGGTGGAGGAAKLDGGGAGGAVGTGGATVPVATGGVVGTGGSVGLDGPLATGGAGGSHDGGALDVAIGDGGNDTPLGIIDGSSSEAGTAGEAAVVPNICTGLTAAACDLAVRNAVVDNTVVAQDVPVTNPPAYSVCSQ